MNPFSHKIVVLLTAALGVAALTTPAHAGRSAPATAGRSVSNGDAGCITEPQWGALRNDCGRDVTIELPLPADGSPPDDYYDVTVTARGESSPQTTVGCWAFGIFNSGGTVFWYSSGSAHYLPWLGTTTSVTVSVYVPPGGALTADCLVNPNAKLRYVNW